MQGKEFARTPRPFSPTFLWIFDPHILLNQIVIQHLHVSNRFKYHVQIYFVYLYKSADPTDSLASTFFNRFACSNTSVKKRTCDEM